LRGCSVKYSSFQVEAEARIGELLKGIDKKESYTGLPSTGGRKLSLPKGISHKQSHYFQALAENKEVMKGTRSRENGRGL
jgi:hypothetical protein